MRANVRKLLCGLGLGAALTGPAAAEEQLVMPFACRVAGGQVLLAPSAPQAYQIYGHREDKRLTTCSPYDPRKCHKWSVHRFDLDCGGARTSWQSVVAALSPMLAEGLGAPGYASGPYEEPAYAPPGPARPYRLGPGRGIAFPPGFAPNPMRIASFKRTGPANARIPLPPKKPVSTAPAQVAEIQPIPEPTAAPPQVAKIEPSHEPVAGPSPTGGDAKASKTASVERKAAELAENQVLQIEIESASGEVTGALPNSGATGALWRDASMAFMLALAVLFALSATLFLGRRRMQTLPMPVAQLPGRAAPPSLARTSSTGLGGAGAHQPPDVAASRLRLWDEDWLPATMSEALDVLGVDPAASREMIRSTVTRLRRALHPDYALDEEDRTLRERRLKQINVAWEIVSGKRHALFLSAKPRPS